MKTLLIIVTLSLSIQAYATQNSFKISRNCKSNIDSLMTSYAQTAFALHDKKISEEAARRLNKMQILAAKSTSTACAYREYSKAQKRIDNSFFVFKPLIYLSEVGDLSQRAEGQSNATEVYFNTLTNHFDYRLKKVKSSYRQGQISLSDYDQLLEDLAADHGVER